MKEVEVLMPRPMMPLIMEELDKRFTVRRLWEAEDAEAFLQEVAPHVRAIATGAHYAVDEKFIDRFPKLEIIANFGVGYDTVDASYCGRKGVVVTNTPDVLTEEVADTALGLLLMTVRELSKAERWVRDGNWAGKGPFPLTKSTLRERSLGILGLGRIGRAIARRAEAFDMQVHYHGRNQQAGVDYTYHPTLAGMAEAVDTLMVVAPGGESTFHLVGERVFDALGPKGVLINVGRGSVVDEKALIQALAQGTIEAAGLDVFENEPHVPQELLDLPNVVVLPHVGSASQHTRDGMGRLVVDNLSGWFETGRVLTPVSETPVG